MPELREMLLKILPYFSLLALPSDFSPQNDIFLEAQFALAPSPILQFPWVHLALFFQVPVVSCCLPSCVLGGGTGPE